jgi:hypothetical protein
MNTGIRLDTISFAVLSALIPIAMYSDPHSSQQTDLHSLFRVEPINNHQSHLR